MTHLGDVQAKNRRASQTKNQSCAKGGGEGGREPIKLVNIYFQLGNQLLIHIVTFPSEMMSEVN